MIKRKFSKTVGGVSIHLNIDRKENNLKEAQKLLNMQIAADTDPFIPFEQGGLRGSLRYPDGIYGGEMEWDSPYAHYQYMGEMYGPNIPELDESGNLIGFWSPPHKHPTGVPLTYHTPGTGSQWFENAKIAHKAEWIALVKRTAGKD